MTQTIAIKLTQVDQGYDFGNCDYLQVKTFSKTKQN